MSQKKHVRCVELMIYNSYPRNKMECLTNFFSFLISAFQCYNQLESYSPMAGDIDRDPVDPVGEGVGLMA